MDSVLDIILIIMEIVLLLVLLIRIIMGRLALLVWVGKYGMVNHVLVDVLMVKFGIIQPLPVFVRVG